MAIANPALSSAKFQAAIDEEQAGWASPGGAAAPTAASAGPVAEAGSAPLTAATAANAGLRPPSGEPTGKVMTYGGTFTATLVYFVLLLAGGWFGWQSVNQTSMTVRDAKSGEMVVQSTTAMPSWLFIVAMVAFGLALLTIFKPKLAMFTGPIYAVAEGSVLGVISAYYNIQYDGIVLEAVLATASVFSVMLFLYATRLIRVTKRFRMMVVGAMMGIMVLYVFTIVASLFGANITFWNQPSPLGIGISVLIVAVASFNLMLQFDMIEAAVVARAPRYMEWYAAFGLMLALVWLYLELLRLLSLIRGR